MPGLFDLTGKRICITGASSGIGQALAEFALEAGASVVAVARREERLKAWAEGRGAKAAVLAADLGDMDRLDSTAAAISAVFGGVDVLVNAAGLNPRVPADDISLGDWRATQDINLNAPFFLARALVPAMAARGWGRVINFASLQSRRAFANGIAYGAAKGGVEQMTRAMAEAWSARGITCNAIAPGFFPTELTRAVFDDAELTARNAAQTCIGRNGVSEDLRGPFIFLASEASAYVTGQVLFVDGGFTAK